MKKNVRNYLIGAVAVAGVIGFGGGLYTAYSKELTKEVMAAEEATTTMAESVSSNYDDSNATGVITLEGNSATGYGSGYNISGNIVTINSAGTYVVRGSAEDMQVVVDADGFDVELVLDGVTLSNTDDAPIFVKNAGSINLHIADGSVNNISDVASEIELTDETEREGNSVIFSKEDLTIDGTGTLNVVGNYKNGITSKDNLTINDGNFVVEATNNGIIGKDSLTVNNGTFN
ncbi:MAG: carbohydrate-binding domain-containing protein, partial [Lachnospirales bacterium]